MTPDVIEMFEKYGVLSKRELESRLETYLEQYVLTVDVEANLAVSMARKLIFPAAIRYQNELAATCANLKLVGIDFDTDTLDAVTELVKGLQDSIATLEYAIEDESASDSLEEARHRCDVVLPAMRLFELTLTSLNTSSLTIFGRCPLIRRCCSSNSLKIPGGLLTVVSLASEVKPNPPRSPLSRAVREKLPGRKDFCSRKGAKIVSRAIWHFANSMVRLDFDL